MSADALIKKVKEIRRARQRLEREWKINLAFYKGNQWVFYNRFTGRIESLPTDDGDKPRFRIRLVSNQILPGVQAYVSMLTKTKPVISATPNSGADRDVKAAQMAEQLFEMWWADFHMKSKLQEALVWSVIAGQGYWKVTWDAQAGASMQVTLDPQTGQPITNPYLADLYNQQLRQEIVQSGIPQDKAMYLLSQVNPRVSMGDIRLDVMSPFNVLIDPTVTSFEDATWVICKHPMSPDEVEARWGYRPKADAVPSDPDIALPFTNSEDKTEPTVKNVYIGYFKPTRLLPKGRYVVFIEGPNKILYDGPWDLPTEDLPIVKFPGVEVPGSPIDEALTTHARPIQKELNRTLSQIVEHKNLTVKPQMIVPTGSLRQRLTNEPGAVYEYTPVAGLKPEWRDMPALPPYVFEHLNEIQARIDRLFNLQAITRGDVPPNVEAGIAIDLLQEAAVDMVAPTIQRIEDSLARAGHLMAAMAQQYYTEPRLLKIKGEGGSLQVKKFLGADIKGGFSFHAEAGSGLPRSRAGRQARIESLVNMGILRPDQAQKYLDIADLKGVQAQMAADEDQAYREHEKIINGEPLNPVAAREALHALAQGANPTTGQPLGPNDDPQELLRNAGLQPLYFENFQQHLETHALFMKSPEFEQLPLQVQSDFLTHWQQTLQTYRSLPVLPQPQPVRTTMQLKGTIDPVTAAQTLRRSGVIDADPNNLAQPPLDTWVTDDLTKPEEQNSGNSHLDAMQQAQQMIHDEETHAMNAAKTQHEIALAKKKAEQSDFRPKPAAPKKAA